MMMIVLTPTYNTMNYDFYSNDDVVGVLVGSSSDVE